MTEAELIDLKERIVVASTGSAIRLTPTERDWLLDAVNQAAAVDQHLFNAAGADHGPGLTVMCHLIGEICAEHASTSAELDQAIASITQAVRFSAVNAFLKIEGTG
jgi:hypothetical protein